MDNSRQRSGSAKAVALILLVGMGLLAWIIQLARAGDPVGYITLTVLLMLITLLVVGLVLALLMLVFGRWVNRPRFDPGEWQSAHQTQKLMRAQLQDMQYLLLQMQNNPGLAQLASQARHNPALLAAGNEWSQPAGAPLEPGQLMTADGLIIDGARFDRLDAEREMDDKNGEISDFE